MEIQQFNNQTRREHESAKVLALLTKIRKHRGRIKKELRNV